MISAWAAMSEADIGGSGGALGSPADFTIFQDYRLRRSKLRHYLVGSGGF